MSVRDARFLRAIQDPDDRPLPVRPSVGFVGRSNAGKSSLINALLGRKGLARSSSTPGCTQALVYFGIDDRYHVVDMPGYGFAEAPKSVRAAWGPMIDRFLHETPELRLVVIVLDARRIPSPDDHAMVRRLEAAGRPYIFAATKIDKLSSSKVEPQLAAIRAALGLEDESGVVPFSSETGTGRQELWSVVRAALEGPAPEEA